MTVVGVALTVAILVADFALVSGLRRVFQSAAHPAHILVLRKGASGEVSSSLPRAAYEDLKFTAGITKKHKPGILLRRSKSLLSSICQASIAPTA